MPTPKNRRRKTCLRKPPSPVRSIVRLLRQGHSTRHTARATRRTRRWVNYVATAYNLPINAPIKGGGRTELLILRDLVATKFNYRRVGEIHRQAPSRLRLLVRTLRSTR